MPPLHELLQFVQYNPFTGEMHRIGKVHNITKEIVPLREPRLVTGLNGDGYKRVRIKGEVYLQHRVAAYMMTGIDPKDNEIDHRDRNPGNNKWSNIRVVDRSENAVNKSMVKRNTSGLTNISKFRTKSQSGHVSDMWRVKVTRYGVNHVKTFSQTDEGLVQAIEWRDAKRDELGFSPTHGLAA